MTNLYNYSNLKLAWERIVSAQNYSYQKLQRNQIEAFGWAIDENLRELRQELLIGSYTPTESVKTYIPKPSGMLRPITVLNAKDTIVYQAIANIIGQFARKRHKDFYYKNVFSNVLTAPKYYPNFFRDWKIGRTKLSDSRKIALTSGNAWMGRLDVTSFYDIIDHKLLQTILSKLQVDTNTMNLLMRCLGKWTIHPKGYEHGHGIPQGPLPSSLLAECVLHIIDIKMTRINNCEYFRYVDDITLMSTSEKIIQIQFSKVEHICRQLGLVPVVKSLIKQLNKIEDLIIDEPSIPSGSVDFPEEKHKLTKKQNDPLRKIFLSCFAGNNLLPDEQISTKLKFVLFRMNADKRLLKKISILYKILPSIYEALNYYLRQFGKDKYVCDLLVNYLETKPLYHIVVGDCIETLYFCCIKGYYSKLRQYCLRAISHHNDIILRRSGLKVLAFRENCISALYNWLLQENHYYLSEQLLFSLMQIIEKKKTTSLLNFYIRCQQQEVSLVSAYLLTKYNFQLLRRKTPINAWATPILSKFGLIKTTVAADRIEEIIKSRYKIKIQANNKFANFLRKREYKQALTHLNIAEGDYNTRRADWVVQSDCFNQILLYRIYIKYFSKVDYDKVFVQLYNNDTHNIQIKTIFPILTKSLVLCHKARSSSLVVHAYSKEKGSFSSEVKPHIQRKLYYALKQGYQEFVNKIP